MRLLPKKSAMLKTVDLFGFWQGLLRVVGSFGDCPRCLAVCPVGNDYHAHLAELQKEIPEKTPEKVALQKQFKEARKKGGDPGTLGMERALGRRGGLQGHGREAAAGIQETPA